MSKFRLLVILQCSLLLFASFVPAAPANGDNGGKTAVQFLRDAGAPKFRAGHTLPPLTWALGGQFGEELQLELTKWGYALFIDPGATGEKLQNPRSQSARLAKLAARDPKHYPVAIYTRRLLHAPTEALALLPEDTWCHDADGKRIFAGSVPATKPYLSDAAVQALADAEQPRLQALKNAGVKVSIVLNAAEYWPVAPDGARKFWLRDPEVKAWIDAQTDKVAAYGEGKAKQEQAVRDAVLQVVGDVPYIYYTTGDMCAGWQNESQRAGWGWPFRYLIRGGTIPSWEFYYTRWQNGTFTSAPRNLVRIATNCAGQGIAAGHPLSYNWVNGGQWTTPGANADIARYEGYLKFLYTLGQIGANAAYCVTPPGGVNAVLGTEPPHWLQQMMALGRVHARFSYLESYLRDGDLLPGDGNHVWTANGPRPSYEFNTGDATAHVAARRLHGKDRWLICAWAADGPDRNVTVTIPDLGVITIQATAVGALYER